jgi:hypothetical protein
MYDDHALPPFFPSVNALLADIFVVVNGVPSVGVQVMCGSGQIETQKKLAVAQLPAPSLPQASSGSDNGSNNGNNSPSTSNQNGASRSAMGSWTGAILLSVFAGLVALQ